MTRNQIIEELFTGKNFRDCIGKMEPARLRDDLAMEVITRLLEQPEEKIVGLHQRKELEYYTVRIIRNELSSKYSQFSKKFMAPFMELNDKEAMAPDEAREMIEREMNTERALNIIGNLYWYDRELIQLYIKHGNYRAIETETGIPWESCYKSIQKSLKQIRCQVLK